jgi:hypothetical protein
MIFPGQFEHSPVHQRIDQLVGLSRQADHRVRRKTVGRG